MRNENAEFGITPRPLVPYYLLLITYYLAMNEV